MGVVMAATKHEINILCRPLQGGDDAAESIRFSSDDWSGSVAAYFEIIYKNTDQTTDHTLYLYDSNGGVEASIVCAEKTQFWTKLFAVCNLNDTYPEKILDLSATAADVTVLAARIIITNDIGASALTACENQIEVGDYDPGIFTENNILALINPKYWYYDSSKWDGTVTFTANVTWECLNDKYSGSIYIEQDDGSFDNWTQVLTILSAGTTEAVVFTESAGSFTPVNGRNYRLGVSSEASKPAYGFTVYNAKIVVTQSDTTAITLLESYILLVNTVQNDTGLQKFLQTWYDGDFVGFDIVVLPEHDASTSGSNTEIHEIHLLDSYSSSSALLPLYSGAVIRRAQTFTNGSVAASLVAARFSFAQNLSANPTGNCYAVLYATSGGAPTGAALATSIGLDVSVFNYQSAWREFVFATPYSLDADTKYAISLEYSGGDVDNYIHMGGDDTSPSHDGDAYAYISSWILDDPATDLMFKIMHAILITDSGITGANRVRGGTGLSMNNNTEIDSNIVTA